MCSLWILEAQFGSIPHQPWPPSPMSRSFPSAVVSSFSTSWPSRGISPGLELGVFHLGEPSSSQSPAEMNTENNNWAFLVADLSCLALVLDPRDLPAPRGDRGRSRKDLCGH